MCQVALVVGDGWSVIGLMLVIAEKRRCGYGICFVVHDEVAFSNVSYCPIKALSILSTDSTGIPSDKQDSDSDMISLIFCPLHLGVQKSPVYLNSIFLRILELNTFNHLITLLLPHLSLR